MLETVVFDRRLGDRLRARAWAHPRSGTLMGPDSSHAPIELAWVEQGALEYQLRSKQTTLRGGQAVVVPSGVEHRSGFLTATRAFSLWLSPELVREVGEVLPRGGALSFGVLERPERLIRLGRLLCEELGERDDGSALAADALSEALIVELLRGTPPPSSGVRDPRIQQAVAQIQAEFAAALSIESLAKTAGMSRFLFSRRFRAETGVSPYRYLMRYRVQRAKELLVGGHVAVTEAALSVGFHDLGRFCRFFRAQYGVNPGQVSRRRQADS